MDEVLYDKTGNIRDVNTVLVPLDKLRELQAEAGRYRAIKARHAYRIMRTFVDPAGGYNSVKAASMIDAWADAAAQDVAEWNAKTPEEQEASFRAEIDRLQAAASLQETK